MICCTVLRSSFNFYYEYGSTSTVSSFFNKHTPPPHISISLPLFGTMPGLPGGNLGVTVTMRYCND